MTIGVFTSLTQQSNESWLCSSEKWTDYRQKFGWSDVFTLAHMKRA